MDWPRDGIAAIAGTPLDGWTTWAGAIGACAGVGGFLLKTRPQIGRWFWGLLTANVRNALLEREIADLREQVDRMYDDRKRQRELSDGPPSDGASGSSPGSAVSPSNPGKKPRTPSTS